MFSAVWPYIVHSVIEEVFASIDATRLMTEGLARVSQPDWLVIEYIRPDGYSGYSLDHQVANLAAVKINWWSWSQLRHDFIGSNFNVEGLKDTLTPVFYGGGPCPPSREGGGAGPSRALQPTPSPPPMATHMHMVESETRNKRTSSVPSTKRTLRWIGHSRSFKVILIGADRNPERCVVVICN